MPTPIQVSIVEDDEPIRMHFVQVLGNAEGIECLSAHGSAEDALRELPERRPDVVLMDIHLPRMSGIECARRVKTLLPLTQIIMLTIHEDSDRIFESLQAGATGYLLKRTPTSEILEGIREIVRGGSPMSGSIARKVIQMTIRRSEPVLRLTTLSARELEVLNLLAEGFLYKEIGDRLEISINTVRNHIRAIYEKLQVQTRTEAVRQFLDGRK